MALSGSLSLNNNAAAAKTFVTNESKGQRVQRIRNDTTSATPCLLVIDHSTQGKGADATNRHLMQVTHTVNDLNGIPRTVIVNLTVTIPVALNTGVDMAKDAVSFIVDLVTGASGCSTEFDSIVSRNES